MRALVTGGTGHIGANLVRSLHDEGHEPVVLARESSVVDHLPDETALSTGSITDKSSLESLLKTISPDAVVHLAAASGGGNTVSMRGGMDSSVATRVNVDGTRNVYEAAAAAGATKFVYLSTIKAHPHIEAMSDSAYVESKIEGERAIEQSEFELPHTTIHPTIVVGPYDFRLHHYYPYQTLHSNRIVVPPLYIPHTTNFAPMENVTSTIIEATQTGVEDRYVVSGENIEYREYLELIVGVSDTNCRVVSVPFAETVIPRAITLLHKRGYLPVSGDVFNWDRSSRVPEKLTDRQPFRSKSLAASIRDTYKWYIETGLL